MYSSSTNDGKQIFFFCSRWIKKTKRLIFFYVDDDDDGSVNPKSKKKKLNFANNKWKTMDGLNVQSTIIDTFSYCDPYSTKLPIDRCSFISLYIKD